MKQKAFAFALIIFCTIFLTLLLVAAAGAQVPATADKAGTVLRAYGPGGPAPAMREAAKVFGDKKGITVEINAGPTPTWKDRAMKDADQIFSGSEYMMTDFVQKDLPNLIDTSTIRTLYLRPSAILVRPGNPKGIKGVKDLAKQGVRILVVQGAGQVGMWEDVAGRTGDVKFVDGVRRNIGSFAPNSAEAKKLWSSDLRLVPIRKPHIPIVRAESSWDEITITRQVVPSCAWNSRQDAVLTQLRTQLSPGVRCCPAR